MLPRPVPADQGTAPVGERMVDGSGEMIGDLDDGVVEEVLRLIAYEQDGAVDCHAGVTSRKSGNATPGHATPHHHLAIARAVGTVCGTGPAGGGDVHDRPADRYRSRPRLRHRLRRRRAGALRARPVRRRRGGRPAAGGGKRQRVAGRRRRRPGSAGRPAKLPPAAVFASRPGATICWPPAAARPRPYGRCTSWCVAGG